MVVSAVAEFATANAVALTEVLGFPLIVMAFTTILAGYVAYMMFRESVFAMIIVQIISFAIFIAFLFPILIMAFAG